MLYFTFCVPAFVCVMRMGVCLRCIKLVELPSLLMQNKNKIKCIRWLCWKCFLKMRIMIVGIWLWILMKLLIITNKDNENDVNDSDGRWESR